MTIKEFLQLNGDDNATVILYNLNTGDTITGTIDEILFDGETSGIIETDTLIDSWNYENNLICLNYFQ